MVEGASSRDVSDRLKIGLRTVEARRTSLMRKLRAQGSGCTDPLRAPSRGHAPVDVEDAGSEDSQQRRSSKVAAPAHRARANIATALRSTRTQLAKVRPALSGWMRCYAVACPAGRMTLFSGGAGSGKSLMACSACCTAPRPASRAFWCCSRNAPAPCVKTCMSLGWDVPAFERKKKLFLLDARMNPEAVISGDFSDQRAVGHPGSSDQGAGSPAHCV